MSTQSDTILNSAQNKLRVGSVSFLNAKPLIYGLENSDALELSLDVPSRLLDGLVQQRLDIALLPVIDYQRMAGLRILTAGGIGCDGPTLTVRIFSPVPIERIGVLACDIDSHTSVALARIILARQFGITPELAELRYERRPTADKSVCPTGKSALLLIGDKVVCEEPRDLPYQLDLGEAWKKLTGLPFVFAAWMARSDIELGTLPKLLTEAKTAGLTHIDQIIRQYALPRGWPPEIARKYLTHHLNFDIGQRQIQAIKLFHELAHAQGVLTQPPRDLQIA
ncbi:MAG TPA: menaquinone biosynthesis protein [Humisphaera sp.]|jgi:chorismate dehydratase|nr:menaquinone biosynthesis protein [Humisphaera sp.]